MSSRRQEPLVSATPRHRLAVPGGDPPAAFLQGSLKGRERGVIGGTVAGPVRNAARELTLLCGAVASGVSPAAAQRPRPGRAS
ncbi:hypothetical protein [Streptomyces sp. NPDC051364]|uniref:hypothetical protein n=1 Tax=Streptomyces sp. NPDC051364 TaxID=3155799 RepID=UPI00341B362B